MTEDHAGESFRRIPVSRDARGTGGFGGQRSQRAAGRAVQEGKYTRLGFPGFRSPISAYSMSTERQCRKDPFLAYDHKGHLVSTIYMVPLKDMDAQKNFAYLASPGGNVDHISLNYNAGHPGVEEPHYHIILWHVPKSEEATVAK